MSIIGLLRAPGGQRASFYAASKNIRFLITEIVFSITYPGASVHAHTKAIPTPYTQSPHPLITKLDMQTYYIRTSCFRKPTTVKLSTLHSHIRLPPEILQQETALEVLVGVNNGLELLLCHDALILGLLDLLLVQMLKYTAIAISIYVIQGMGIDLPITCHMELLLVFILFNALENRAIINTHSLDKC